MLSRNTKTKTKKSPEVIIANQPKTIPNSDAKEKARWARIKRVYGITKEQYVQLDLGYCPICVRDWSDIVRPNVDHDHVSGDIRGLLCTFCNRYRVGRLRDSELVYRIAAYLGAERRGWIVPPKKRKRKRKVRK